MQSKDWNIVLKDVVLPLLAVLLTAYNVYSIHNARKDSYNDILFTQQMTATGEIAEHISVYQGELIALLHLGAEAPPSQRTDQTARAVDAGRTFSKAFTKWAPIMPDGLLLEMTRYHAVASRTLEPFQSGALQDSAVALPPNMERDLTRSYAKVFQRMRAELGVDALNGESKLLLEKLQSERREPRS